ncbi:VOC family protein [Nitratireductor aquimarinus]|uniref:VOC family protein n=1 Tax=Nitratireductor aquimarinus TaxID=889300 RepID=UPI001CD388E7|nr:VOC family protein [Nitratireductor aquimarinus]MCA1303910.1 VOC family protein [Nitratireductor aquimarinus]
MAGSALAKRPGFGHMRCMVSEDKMRSPRSLDRKLNRKLDHCVLPTAGLTVARQRLEALGFTVAADAAHPFGTGNCCVFLSDGSYLEPLARMDQKAAFEAEADGNVFIERDSVFRQTYGDEGFSAVVLGTADADADHARFVDAGISAGKPLSFSRPFRDAEGREATASFRLAFAAPENADGHFFFTCQRINMPTAGRGALETHSNGVTGTARIVMLAASPDDYAGFLDAFSDEAHERLGDGEVDLRLGNAVLTVMTPDRYAMRYGLDRVSPHGRFDLAAIVFECLDIARLREQFSIREILFADEAGSIIVPPAAGQGTVFVFEESSL